MNSIAPKRSLRFARAFFSNYSQEITRTPLDTSHNTASPHRCEKTKSPPTVSDNALDDVACVGWDGAPLFRVDQVNSAAEWAPRKEDENRDEHQKPSPISEIAYVDTRKPITRAMDAHEEEPAPTLVPDTVDAALARAERLFREAVERGDPDSPPARVLARLLAQRGKYNL